MRDALWKVESARLEEWDSPGGLVVAGMGGSAIGGALAKAALGDQASRPIFSARAYGLPAWTTPDTTVLCASYSGNTEETLACYEAAGMLGAHRIVVTSGGELARMARKDDVPVIPVAGGLQPRAAVAYMTIAALEVARLCGAAPRMTTEIDVAAEHLEELVTEWGPDGSDASEAKVLARGAARRDPDRLRLGPDGGRRVPVEDPDQRERQAAGVRERAARAGPQRDLRLVGCRRASAGSRPCSSATPTSIRACATGSS